MHLTCITYVLLLGVLIGVDDVTSQVEFDIQSLLNQVCSPGSTNIGCSKTADGSPVPPVSPHSFTESPITPAVPTPGSASQRCSILDNEKFCPQLPNKCVPSNIECNKLDAGVTCGIIDDYGLRTQVLICGGNTIVGAKCERSGTVPVLTTLLAQCQGSNDVDPQPISSLKSIYVTGDDAAGMYMCSSSGNWEAMNGSPFINELIASCRDSGCGRVPHPTRNLALHRPWGWVRGINLDGKLHCTGTLVSKNALVTAAHCVTQSVVSNDVYSIDRISVDLPGPNSDNPTIDTTATQIQIHPKYTHRNGMLVHDLAIIFFRSERVMPTVCISARKYIPDTQRSQVVFALQGQRDNGSPIWKTLLASWDHSCISTHIQVGTGCSDPLQVQNSQFCVSHKGISLSQGSSGGPYLAEVGERGYEVWVLMGVLSSRSQIENDPTCAQEHSVYSHVSDDFRWIKECVFDKKCTI